MSLKSKFYIIAVCLLVLSMFFVEEVEGRRKILRGRKTITRTYYKQMGIPAWAVVTIVGIGLLLVGGGVYVLMDKCFLGDLSTGTDTYRTTKKSKLSAS